MKQNRKKVETYRFNGSPYLHAHSINPVTIIDLESLIEGWEAKPADPNDADDKQWTERWLNRFKAELSKKRRGLSFKAKEMMKPTSRRRERPTPESPDA